LNQAQEMSTATDISKKDAFVRSILDSRDSLGLTVPAAWKTEAASALAVRDFPTSKTETWKYTRTGRLAGQRFAFKPDARDIDVTPFVIEGADDIRCVFVNGFFRAGLSKTPDLAGLYMQSATEAEARDLDITSISEPDLFTGLNTAAFNGGAFIKAEKNTRIETPIHLIFIQTQDGAIAQPRLAIRAESGAALTVVCSYYGANAGSTFLNSVCEVNVAENASLDIVLLQADHDEAFQINTIEADQGRNSRLSISTITADGGWLRNNVRINLRGTGCETHLNGAYIPTRKQHQDNRTVIDHLQPHCVSNELYKGILRDEGTGVFNGKVYVRQDAQKTNAFQKNANIVLSDKASMNSKPELEIYADDVKCSHGSTTGRLDEQALFYLMQRGLSADTARGLLASAFVADVVNQIASAPIREKARQLLTERKGLTFE
jgi:Fe-S cluster assembly protein SufD